MEDREERKGADNVLARRRGSNEEREKRRNGLTENAARRNLASPSLGSLSVGRSADLRAREQMGK